MAEQVAALLEEIKSRDEEIIRLGIEKDVLAKANLELFIELERLKKMKKENDES